MGLRGIAYSATRRLLVPRRCATPPSRSTSLTTCLAQQRVPGRDGRQSPVALTADPSECTASVGLTRYLLIFAPGDFFSVSHFRGSVTRLYGG